jgi:hypothetical protein
MTLKLDLVFLVDNTGSMGSYIQQVQNNIKTIVTDISKAANVDVQFNLVSYRDHPPQDSSYITQVSGFTNDLNKIQGFVDQMSASGGGDGPEAVTTGLYEVLKISYRKDSTKVCIFIADAPPHGLGEDGDGFPEGEPNKYDPIKIAHAMSKKGIIVYSIGCEPAISHYKFAKQFMMAISFITEGRYVPLEQSDLLTKVIVGGTQEEVDISGCFETIEKEAKAQGIQFESIDELPYDFLLKVYHQLVQKKLMTTQLIVEKTGAVEADPFVDDSAKLITKNGSLSKAKEALLHAINELNQKNAASSTPAVRGRGGRGRGGRVQVAPRSDMQRVYIAKDFITFDQVKRALSRKVKMIRNSNKMDDLMYI